MKSRHVQISGRGQRVLFQELVTWEPTASGRAHADKLRVTIQVDRIASQASATVERWDGNAWRELWTIPGEVMSTNLEIGYQEPGPADFAGDRTDLLRIAREVMA